MPIAFMHGGSKPTPRKSSDKSDEKEVRRQIFGRRGTIAVPAYSTTAQSYQSGHSVGHNTHGISPPALNYSPNPELSSEQALKQAQNQTQLNNQRSLQINQHNISLNPQNNNNTQIINTQNAENQHLLTNPANPTSNQLLQPLNSQKSNQLQLCSSDPQSNVQDGNNTKQFKFINSDNSGGSGGQIINSNNQTQQQIDRSRVRLNISGLVYETHIDILDQLPLTLLGNKFKRQAYWDDERLEYFFDRHRDAFQSILYFYQTGGETLICPPDVPDGIFEKEIRFFELLPKKFKIQNGVISCQRAVKSEPEDVESNPVDAKYLELRRSLADPTLTKISFNDRLRIYTWEWFEHPKSSHGAQVFAYISTFLIVISTATFVIETLPSVRNSNPSHDDPIYMKPKKIIWYTEHICVMFFTLELIGRFWACPLREAFFHDRLNIIDVIAILPNFIEMLWQGMCALNIINRGEDEHETGVNTTSSEVTQHGINVVKIERDVGELIPNYYFNCTYPKDEQGQIVMGEWTCQKDFGGTMPDLGEDSTSFAGYIVVLRIFRVARVMKLSRRSHKLTLMAKTIGASLKELSFLFIFICFATILFGTFMYFAERNVHHTQFTSIPHSFWYCVVTMTTVGYGDMAPKTFPGKIVGFFCALTGVLCIALPVPSIVDNFHRLMFEDKSNQEGDDSDDEDDDDDDGSSSYSSMDDYGDSLADQHQQHKSHITTENTQFLSTGENDDNPVHPGNQNNTGGNNNFNANNNNNNNTYKSEKHRSLRKATENSVIFNTKHNSKNSSKTSLHNNNPFSIGALSSNIRHRSSRSNGLLDNIVKSDRNVLFSSVRSLVAKN